MASGVIPQITAIFGTCGGGLALVPALTDFTFMEGKKAELFVNSPNALDGNSKDQMRYGICSIPERRVRSGGFHRQQRMRSCAGIRELVSMLPANNEDDMSYEDCTDDLNRVCADLANAAGDPAILLSNIADDNNFVEVKAAYAKGYGNRLHPPERYDRRRSSKPHGAVWRRRHR